MIQRRLHILNIRNIHYNERNLQVPFTYEDFDKISHSTDPLS
jgi:hypothetical protein